LRTLGIQDRQNGLNFQEGKGRFLFFTTTRPWDLPNLVSTERCVKLPMLNTETEQMEL
jgi:hypothetical protein